MNKRPKRIWRSQYDCVNAWLTQECRLTHIADAVFPDEGWAKGWWRSRTLHFKGLSMYSLEAQEVEIARLVKNLKHAWVVVVRRDEHESLERGHRTEEVRRRAKGAGLPWISVGQFDVMAANQTWYSARVAQRYGKWQRARRTHMKSWRWNELVYMVEERARFEALFGLSRTKEEAEVRCARIVQRLSGP